MCVSFTESVFEDAPSPLKKFISGDLLDILKRAERSKNKTGISFRLIETTSFILIVLSQTLLDTTPYIKTQKKQMGKKLEKWIKLSKYG